MKAITAMCTKANTLKSTLVRTATTNNKPNKQSNAYIAIIAIKQIILDDKEYFKYIKREIRILRYTLSSLSIRAMLEA